MNSIRVATWNLGRLSPIGQKAKPCRKLINDVNANIWAFTEIREDFNPGLCFRQVAVSTPAKDLDRKERWSAIWIDDSVKVIDKVPLKSKDATRIAYAGLLLENGQELYVYATVLPWLGSTWGESPAAGGEAFRAALSAQQEDWAIIRKARKDAWLCVAGDFNQDLLEAGHYYGSKNQRTLLRNVLGKTSLSGLTGGKEDPVVKLDPNRANIDHICVAGPQGCKWTAANTQAKAPVWEGLKVSDHYCVWTDIRLI